MTILYVYLSLVLLSVVITHLLAKKRFINLKDLRIYTSSPEETLLWVVFYAFFGVFLLAAYVGIVLSLIFFSLWSKLWWIFRLLIGKKEPFPGCMLKKVWSNL